MLLMLVFVCLFVCVFCFGFAFVFLFAFVFVLRVACFFLCFHFLLFCFLTRQDNLDNSGNQQDTINPHFFFFFVG